MNKRRIVIGVLVALVLVVIVGAGVFVYWANQTSLPTATALAALQTDSQVTFHEQNGWLVFSPTGHESTTGLVIYPGAKVDARAYAAVAHAIAAQGYLVVITPVRLNLALLDSDAAAPILAAFPKISTWALAGHSLGGTAAAQFAQNHPNQVDGLIFWASYPAGDMTNWGGKVLSISGTQDGLATPAKIEENKKLEPATTQFVVVDGGDHAQFGAYGAQAGDNAATISPEAQQSQVVAATVEFLKQFSTSN